MKIFITGAKGFIAGYLIAELLKNDFHVIGIDNNSKYGKLVKSYDEHPHYEFIEGDAKDLSIMREALKDCTHFIAAAAMIGGICYFHEFAYDLIAENERITAAAFDAAIWAHKKHKLRKITIISSSMVFENTRKFPTKEGEQIKCPPPKSTYGFQKLAAEYFAKGAWEQYKLPYTILRPFNCVGTGEYRAKADKKIMSGNIELALSHVIPDLIQKVIKGQNPLHILGNGKQVRHFTYGGDIAGGIRLSLENEKARNQDFNLSGRNSMKILDVAKKIWQRINPHSPFKYICDEPYMYDVKKRIPDTKKAARLLGFEAKTDLDAILDEVVPWIEEQARIGNI